MEGRACLAEWDDRDQRLTLWTSTQVPHLVRTTVAGLLGIPEHRLRVVAPGRRRRLRAEVRRRARGGARRASPRAAPAAPVKWVEDRQENLASGFQGHEQRFHVRAGLRRRRPDPRPRRRHPVRRRRVLDAPVHLRRRAADGGDRAARALRGALLPRPGPRGREQQGADGAVPRRLAPADGARDGAADAEGGAPRSTSTRSRSAGATSSRPTRSRGPARPASSSTAAATTRRSRPARTRSTTTAFARAPARRPRRGPAARARDRLLRRAHRLRDRGVQPAQDGGDARLRQRARPDGPVGRRDRVRRHLGPRPGPPDHARPGRGRPARPRPRRDVEVRQSDTDATPYGWGTFASRSMVVGGGATASRDRRARRPAPAARRAPARGRAGRRRAARRPRAVVRGSPDRGLALADLARVAYLEAQKLPEGEAPGLEEHASFDPPGTFSNATHGCIVEIDPDTGAVAHRALRRRRGLRRDDQPGDRRGPGARRRRPGHRGRAVRGAGLHARTASCRPRR